MCFSPLCVTFLPFTSSLLSNPDIALTGSFCWAVIVFLECSAAKQDDVHGACEAAMALTTVECHSWSYAWHQCPPVCQPPCGKCPPSQHASHLPICPRPLPLLSSMSEAQGHLCDAAGTERGYSEGPGVLPFPALTKGGVAHIPVPTDLVVERQSVMSSLGNRPDYIWNHLKFKMEGTPVRVFSFLINSK